MDYRDLISADANVCHGQPCIRGTRIMVWLIVQLLANGDSVDDVLVGYPSISRQQVQACLAFAADALRERVLPMEVAA